ncbi:tRNA (adenosine(37)-N6)-threonylcarbamoyltransferase complex transferase subunit TsaD [Candidatus Microgenomates bacterium]|nr:MAG: tRNA (adenosine(37)-N6)-threonylcarbamoyltransferase complex transferase subunit TsaD [Candidatus Microgenomates bacterium]
MKILGIETSCDETAAAVVENGKIVVSSAIATSVEMHAKTGGIVPENAAREQIKSIIPVVDQVMANIDRANINAIAVTVGPGLIGSLLVGVETAKTLSFVWDKPIIPVNHLVSHIYAVWINNSPKFPCVALVVSGGHTDFVLMHSHKKLEWLGGTRDDAAGEAFDKTARLLGLSYPGGPAIAKESEKYANSSAPLTLFPRPMINSNDLDMSFSGLKTAVVNEIKRIDPASLAKRKGELAAQVQEAIVDTLVSKSLFATKKHKPKSFILAGGVSANHRLREKITNALSAETRVYIPELRHSTDNAVMVAACANFIGRPSPWPDIVADPNLSIVSSV